MDDQLICRDCTTHEIRLQAVWAPPRSRGQPWLRRFGRPAGIEPGIRVVLVIENAAVATLTLNGTALPQVTVAGSRWTYDVTNLLRDRNELLLMPAADELIVVGATANAHGRVSLPIIIGRVALEILTPSRAER